MAAKQKEPLPTSVRLSPPLKKWLEQRAKEEDRSLGSLLRRALLHWAEQNGYPGPTNADDD